jgi:hypothetical protein
MLNDRDLEILILGIKSLEADLADCNCASYEELVF